MTRSDVVEAALGNPVHLLARGAPVNFQQGSRARRGPAMCGVIRSWHLDSTPSPHDPDSMWTRKFLLEDPAYRDRICAVCRRQAEGNDTF